MHFRWNNAWQKSLSVSERQQVLHHEMGHLALSSAGDEAKGVALQELRDFSRGYPCPEPLTEGKCILDLRVPAPREKDWKIAKDYIINKVS